MEEIYFRDNIRYPLGTFEREPSTLYVTFTNDLCLFWRIKSIYSSVFKLRGGCSPAIPSPQVLLCHTTRKANMDEYRIYMADKEARKTHHYISSVIASETEVVLDITYFEHFYMNTHCYSPLQYVQYNDSGKKYNRMSCNQQLPALCAQRTF